MVSSESEKSNVCEHRQRILDRCNFVSGIILAGGKSRRMSGVNKALLNIGRESIIERVRDVVQQILPRTIIITNTPEEFAFLGLPMFPDIIPNTGSLGGLYTGLSHCQSQFGFVVACDMPFLNAGIIRAMIGLIEDYDVVIPSINGQLEPLHAIYSIRCTSFVHNMLCKGDLKILDLFSKVRTRRVSEEFLKEFDPDFHFVMNVNNPDDLRKAIAMDAEHGGPTGFC